jgi:hypothetical protein
VRSLNPHFEDIKADPNVLCADVIGFAETKLMRSDANDKYALPGFGLPIRNDQHQSVVRTRPPYGLIVYVREGFVVDELSVFSTPDLEYIMADIISCKGHIQVVFLYKAPNCKFIDFKEELLSNLVPVLNMQASNIMIMGDFNFDITGKQTKFLDFMEKTFLCKQIILKKTTRYGSILDLAFVKVNPDVTISSDVLEAYWSDHRIIYAALDL